MLPLSLGVTTLIYLYTQVPYLPMTKKALKDGFIPLSGPVFMKKVERYQGSSVSICSPHGKF
ncbi:hypothetical protein ADA01nite_12410 [Aneurinibacillus danicus]|uniref:Uncharacterized protein n=1 Tax=Aneurinibacillus danicus TaxID=267746 RepID=A0A511V6J5_9BACL|nr:hypothetical protein ADA01nite_12410 [Aneurinibacillus danicus]